MRPFVPPADAGEQPVLPVTPPGGLPVPMPPAPGTPPPPQPVPVPPSGSAPGR
jgi:hypothetical protein